MSKISLTDVGSITQNPISAATAINDNNTAIETAFDNTLSRDGTSPNNMGANIDMNSNRVLNLPSPVANSEPLRLQDLIDFNGGGTIVAIPSGGSAGQALTKNSNTNFDVTWSNVVSSVGLSLPADFNVTGSPVTTTGTLTATLANTPTGTGGFVRQVSPTINNATLSSPTLSSPTMTAAVLGTPASGTLTNCTGLPVTTGISGMAANVSTFLATPSSANLASAVTDETGSGALVFGTSPTIASATLTTPNIGVATATSVNKMAITAPATSSTLAVADGKTATISNTLTFSGTDSSTLNVGVGGTLTGSSSSAVYYDIIPQNSKSTAYTTVLSDGQKHILHPSADNNARTFTIDSNANVAYPIGTAITFVNLINTVTIAITSDTMILAGSGTTGSRTLAANGVATALKVASTTWIISGTGLT